MAFASTGLSKFATVSGKGSYFAQQHFENCIVAGALPDLWETAAQPGGCKLLLPHLPPQCPGKTACAWCATDLQCAYNSTRQLAAMDGRLVKNTQSLLLILTGKAFSCCKLCPCDKRNRLYESSRLAEFMAIVPPLTYCVDAARTGCKVDEQSAFASTSSPLHCTELPDLVCLTTHVSWTIENVARHKLPILHILSKLAPCRCLFRGWTQAVHKYCLENDAVCKTMMHILGTSLLGLYPWVQRTKQMSLQTAYRTVSFLCHSGNCKLFVDWCGKYPHILFYAAKEALLYYTTLNVTLRKTLEEVYVWDNFSSDICRWSSQIRTWFVEGESWSAIERNAKRFSTTSTYVHKLTKSPFHKMVLGILKSEVDASSFVLPEQTLSTVALVAARMSVDEIQENVAELLFCCGGERTFAALIQSLTKQYDCEGISVNRLRRQFSSWPIQQKTVLYNLFYATARVNFVEVVPTTAEICNGQRRSIQLRHGINDSSCTMRLDKVVERNLLKCVEIGQSIVEADGACFDYNGDTETLLRNCDQFQFVQLTVPPAKLPPRAGVVYFCPVCIDLKAFVNDENPLNVHAVGNPRVLYDVETGRLRCNRRKVCGQAGCAEVIPVQLIGKILRFSINTTTWYTLCPRCASVTTWTLQKTLRACGFACNECVAEDKKLQLSFKRKRVQCLYCNVTHNEERTWAKVNVYNEQTGLTELVHLCQRHSCRWIGGPPVSRRSMTKTQLIQFVSKQANLSRR